MHSEVYRAGVGLENYLPVHVAIQGIRYPTKPVGHRRGEKTVDALMAGAQSQVSARRCPSKAMVSGGCPWGLTVTAL